MSAYDPNDLYDIHTYSNQTQVVLRWLYEFTQNVVFAKETPEFIISLIGIFLNIFHLTILTRKSMRSTSTNVLMIGIAINDLFIMMYWATRYMLTYIFPDPECSIPWSYFRTLADLLAYSMKDNFRRVSAWLGVLMAATRLLIIKNPLNPKFDFLSRSSFSWTVILALIFLSTSFSLADKSRMQVVELPWTPPEQCNGFPENFTGIDYFVYVEHEKDGLQFERMIMFTEGMAKVVPAILLPILTFLLVRELKTAANARRKLTSSQEKDHTTKLVILMTVSFMIAEGPLGIVFAAEGLINSVVILVILNNCYVILTVFVVLNATTHCLICMTMSSQYRNCVKSLFCGKIKPRPVSTKASVSSVVSVRNVKVTT